MQTGDLIQIGYVNTRYLPDAQAKVIVLKLHEEFQHLATQLSDVFLLFTDHRVRYAKMIFTSDDKKNTARHNGIEVSFDDTDLIDEIYDTKKVAVCLDEDELSRLSDDAEYFDPIGMNVIWNDEVVAHIKGFFFNGAHDVYEILLTNGSEILIPDVDEWVIQTNIPQRYIMVRDLDQFINL